MNARKIIHPFRLLLFTFLSLADLCLTYALIQDGDGQVYESNPIAAAWLSSYGWSGLILFKLVIIAIVGTVAAFVSVSHPRAGGRILTFACLAVAVVVAYSTHMRISERLHAQFMASPIANTSGRFPGFFRIVLGPGPAKVGWNASALQAPLPGE
jgi:hypothetical protein